MGEFVEKLKAKRAAAAIGVAVASTGKLTPEAKAAAIQAVERLHTKPKVNPERPPGRYWLRADERTGTDTRTVSTPSTVFFTGGVIVSTDALLKRLAKERNCPLCVEAKGPVKPRDCDVCHLCSHHCVTHSQMRTGIAVAVRC